MDNWGMLPLALLAAYIAVSLPLYYFGGRGKTWAAALLGILMFLIMMILWATSDDMPLWMALLLGIGGAAMMFISWRYVLPRQERIEQSDRPWWGWKAGR